MSLSDSRTPEAIQELGVVFCLDSSAITLGFWQKGFTAYIVPLLQTMAKVHNQQAPGAILKTRVGTVVFTRSNVTPSLLSNTYFTDASQFFQQFQTSMLSTGLGATTTGGDSGMAAIEGLVAAVEMCDRLTSEAAKPRRTNAPPNFPQQPQRKQPICHIILFTSQPPGGSPTPLNNKDYRFDSMTMDTLPPEIAKRNIKFSCILINPIPSYIDFFSKVGESAEKPWFNTAPGHVILLSGFQHAATIGGADSQSTIKRPVPPSTPVPGDASKKTKLVTSPVASNKATPIATASQDPTNATPQALPTAAATATSNPVQKSQMPNIRTAQEYGQSQRDKASAQIAALNSKMPGPSNILGVQPTADSNSAEDRSSGAASDKAPAGTPTNPAPAPPMTKAASSSGAIASSAGNGPAAVNEGANLVRPQSQPQNMTLHSQIARATGQSGTHSRLQFTTLPTSVPASVRDSPNLTKVAASPALSHRSQPGGNTVGPSPRPSSVNMSSPKRGEGGNSNPAGGPSVNQDPKMAAILGNMPTSDNRLIGSAEAQQKVLHSRMQGLINPGTGPPSIPNAPPEPHLPQNTDLWQGNLMFIMPDGKGGAQEIPVSVLAKRGGPPNARHPQFVVWPSLLRFSPLQLRPFKLQELAAIIKQNGIPLCMIEPNAAPFNENMEAKSKNEQTFARLHQILTQHNAGAVINFDVPAGPQGTGVFVFSPPPRDGVRLVGAVFLTQPIPHLSPPEPQGVPNPGPPLGPAPAAGGIGMGPRPLGIQNPNAGILGGATNPQMFDPAIRNQLLLRQQQQQQTGGQLSGGMLPGQPAWMQRMASQSGIAGPDPTGVVGMGTGMAGPSAAGIGGIMGQQHINPQAQAQNRLLSGGLNVGGMAGVGGGMGGFDGAGAGMGMGGNMMTPGVGNQMGMMNLPGGMVNMGGMNMGLPGGLQGMQGIPPEMLRFLAQQQALARGGPGGLGPS